MKAPCPRRWCWNLSCPTAACIVPFDCNSSMIKQAGKSLTGPKHHVYKCIWWGHSRATFVLAAWSAGLWDHGSRQGSLNP